MITWDTLLAAESGSASNVLSGFVSRHPNPVKDILDSNIVPTFGLDFTYYFQQTAKIIFEFFLVWLVLVVAIACLHILVLPLTKKILQWEK